MIEDSSKNLVYFSEKLKEAEFEKEYNEITKLLDKYEIDYLFLKETKDIWCRDYMPIQISRDSFIQFKFDPSYLKCSPELRSVPEDILKVNGLKANFSNIKLDGGNLINCKDKVILTKRIFKENPQMETLMIQRELIKLFDCDVFFIHDINSDLTGHVDGHIRFLNNDLILVNSINEEYEYWKKSFFEMIKNAKLEYIEMPRFNYKIKGNHDHAFGIYVNYLEIGKLILFPIFEVEGNKDMEAMKIMESVFNDRYIEPININNIALLGGLMNCITWTIEK